MDYGKAFELARLEPRRSTRNRPQTMAFDIDTITPAPKRVNSLKHPHPAEPGSTSDVVVPPPVQPNYQVDAQPDEPVDAPLTEPKTLDSIVPEELPHGCTPPSPFEGDVTLYWYQVVSLRPMQLIQFLTDTTRNIHTFPCLTALNIPKEHWAHVFMDTKCLTFIHIAAWVMAAGKKLFHNQITKAPNVNMDSSITSWNRAIDTFFDEAGAAFFSEKREQLLHRGYCVLEDFGDWTHIPPEVILKMICSAKFDALNPFPESMPDGSLEKMTRALLDTFPAENVLEDEAAPERHLWNPIVNLGEEERDKQNRDKGIARFQSTRKLLMETVELDEETVWI